MKDQLQNINSCMGDERWRVVDKQLEELLPFVLDDLHLVMTIGVYLSWVSMDNILV